MTLWLQFLDPRPQTRYPIPMILLIDNYDSFTYNLVQRIGELDATLDLRVIRNDKVTAVEAAAKDDPNVAEHLEGKRVRKVIVIKGRLINLVMG